MRGPGSSSRRRGTGTTRSSSSAATTRPPGSPTSTFTCSGQHEGGARRGAGGGHRAASSTVRRDGCGCARGEGSRREDGARPAHRGRAAAPLSIDRSDAPAYASGRGRETRLIVGIPQEVKDNEFRVAATPEGVRELVHAGHRVVVETGAGDGSALPDARLRSGGCRDPPGCRRRLRLGRHDPQGEGAAAAGVRAVPGGTDPVYVPPSGGRRGAHAVPRGAKGRRRRVRDRAAPGRPASAPGADVRDRRPDGSALRRGQPGATQGRPRRADGRRRRASRRLASWCWAPGMAGTNAAWIAAGMEAEVAIVDKNVDRLRFVDQIWRGRIQTVMSSRLAIERLVTQADLVIGAVLVPGAKAPRLVTEDMVAGMPPGAVVVDISIDQGGCFETSTSRRIQIPPTSARRRPLLRREHAGRRPADVDVRPHERHDPVCGRDRDGGAGGRRARTTPRSASASTSTAGT